MPAKRKPTHVPFTISINSKKRGKVQNNTITISEHSNEPNFVETSASTESGIPLNFTDQPIQEESVSVSQKPYYDKKQKEITAWQEFRELAVQCLFERQAPTSRECLFCKAICNSPVRCLQCSSTYTACVSCVLDDHKLRPLHKLEIWTNGHYKRLLPDQLPVLSHPNHASCPTYSHAVTLVDRKGCVHNTCILVCNCVTPASLLIKLGFWPSNTTKPSMAFDIDFLELSKSLLLESQTSTKAFIESHRLLNHMSIEQGSKLYRNIIGTPIEEFRHACAMMQHQLKLPNEPRCPACLDGNKVVSIDANFGLVRKQSSGKSFENSKHPEKFLISASDVQFHVSAHQSSVASKTQDCNSFKAGENVRSKQKNRKLDEKGVFGSVCRHEIPLLFLNLPEGERLAYPAYLLSVLLQDSRKIFLTYDIACKFEAYLKRTDPNMLRRLVLAIPIFHCYGHKKPCQIKYNPRRISGYGLCDGEGIERLWSFLRRFSSITKEMTPVHRDSLLNEALAHLRRGKIEALGVCLSLRFHNAIAIRDQSQRQLDDLCIDSEVEYSNEVVEQWLLSETSRADKMSKDDTPSWSETYVDTLIKLEQARVDFVDTGKTSEAKKKILTSLEKKKATKMETEQNIVRWDTTNAQYQDTLSKLKERNERAILCDLLSLANERAFYCSLKRKYCDGQAVAMRLSRLIQKTVGKLKMLLDSYNSTAAISIDFADAINPEAYCYSIYRNETATSVDITSALDLHFRKVAAQEEIELTCKEAQQLCDMTFEQIQHLWGINCPVNTYGEGVRAVSFSKVVSLENTYDSFRNLFQNMSVLMKKLPNRITIEDNKANNDILSDAIAYVESDDE